MFPADSGISVCEKTYPVRLYKSYGSRTPLLPLRLSVSPYHEDWHLPVSQQDTLAPIHINIIIEPRYTRVLEYYGTYLSTWAYAPSRTRNIHVDHTTPRINLSIRGVCNSEVPTRL
jgi:hypothetical protein